MTNNNRVFDVDNCGAEPIELATAPKSSHPNFASGGFTSKIKRFTTRTGAFDALVDTSDNNDPQHDITNNSIKVRGAKLEDLIFETQRRIEERSREIAESAAAQEVFQSYRSPNLCIEHTIGVLVSHQRRSCRDF